MGNIIDSHAHVYLEQFDKDRDEIIRRAQETGIKKILMPDVDSETTERMLEAELRYPDMCVPMIGLHPCSVGKDVDRALYKVEEWLAARDWIAIGEIGTDLYWDKTYWPQQQEALKVQLDWAQKAGLPVVLHCRESIDETIELVKGRGRKEAPGIFHCFTGSLQQAQAIVEMGYFLGIGGVATFKNGGLEEVLTEIPLENMVVETDSPYLAPVPYRGKRNEPGFISEVVAKIAAIKEVDPSEVASRTSLNCETIFGSL